MKKEILTTAMAAGMALTGSAHWGHGGCYGWPAIGFGLLAGGLAARAYTDAVWASRGYVPYGYGVAVAPVVYQTAPVVYQQPAQQVVYQQPAPVVYPQQTPVAQPVQQAPQPQEIRIVVDHQCSVQTSVQTNLINAVQQQREQ